MSLAPKTDRWQPSADINTLRKRADILKNIRAFFLARDVLEVETPLMCHTSVTDPYIDSIPAYYQASAQQQPECFYLQTSPEYAMKRLLAAGSGSIFQLCKAFRQAENGHLHNPEFTMLEWYRIGFNHLQLMQEVDELLQLILATPPADKITYQQLFLDTLQIDIHAATVDELKKVAAANNIYVAADIHDIDTWLQLLLMHCIEPNLGKHRPCFIYNFPASQAALARLNDDNTAARFEVYFHGMELANGFHELTDAKEQRRRFDKNNQTREAQQATIMPVDELFLAALEAGLPDCSGVALGVDRLVMLALQMKTIQQVLSFDVGRA